MNALQFVKGFADRFDLDHASLRVIDRALADAGLRKKAKGRHRPDISLKEGIGFVFAVLANQNPTQAAKSAVELANFHLLYSGPKHSRHKAVVKLGRLINRPAAELMFAPLFDVVFDLCRRFPDHPRLGLELSVHRNAGGASLMFSRDADDYLPENGLLFKGQDFTLDIETRRPVHVKSAEPRDMVDTRTAMPKVWWWVSENANGSDE